MNLVADIGTTRIKIAFFDSKNLIAKRYFLLDETHAINEFIKKNKADRAIISSVTDKAALLINKIKSELSSTIEYSAQTPIPIRNLYKTAFSLGGDRIPPVIAAQQIFPKSDVLVIDAGTCIKFNFLNKQGEYMGGSIAPGLNMRFNSLHTFTSRLPLISQDADFEKLIGTDTRESILAGVQIAALAEVNGLINQYNERYKNLKIALTGGDSAFFEKRLKNAIFADPDLVLKGLNIILNFNTPITGNEQ